MKNPNIAKVLKEYRKKNKYTVQDVSIMLKERSIKVATVYDLPEPVLPTITACLWKNLLPSSQALAPLLIA